MSKQKGGLNQGNIHLIDRKYEKQGQTVLLFR